jgi:hypothetical protein
MLTLNTTPGGSSPPFQFRERAQRALALDRVLHHAQSLVYAVQTARHLGFVSAHQFAQRIAHGFLRVGPFVINFVQRHQPDRQQQQAGKQGSAR